MVLLNSFDIRIAVASTTRSGLGQSLCIGMGGDVIAGTNFVDALKIFEEDGDTDGIVLIGEIGGFAELEAAEWIKEYKTRSSNPKPIAALVGGAQVTTRSFGKVMGHVSTISQSFPVLEIPNICRNPRLVLLHFQEIQMLAQRLNTSKTPALQWSTILPNLVRS